MGPKARSALPPRFRAFRCFVVGIVCGFLGLLFSAVFRPRFGMHAVLLELIVGFLFAAAGFGSCWKVTSRWPPLDRAPLR